MGKKRERSVNISGKPKHSLDVNRSNDSSKKESRSASTVRRLKMYKTRPVRERKGKVLSHDLQSKELPSTRIQPDRRWFGNTRVVNQKELEFFREELQTRMSSNYNVILKQKKLPLSLLNDRQKQARVHLLDREPFTDAFGPKTKRKRPTLLGPSSRLCVIESFEQKYDASVSSEVNEGDGFRDLVRHTMFEKGQSKCIWGELYKVIDSSDVVVLGGLEFCQKNIQLWPFHASINKSFGKGSLLSILRQFARLKSDKQAIPVGFVGYPNVGKSSVINTLRTKNVCKVAPIPGETKVWQYITLTKRIFLIDCPGTCECVTNLQDAADHIGEVLKRVKKQHLERAYKIKEWEDDNYFLVQLCKSSGKLLRGGEPDLMTAAKMILHDWQKGRIPFFVPCLDDLSEEPEVNGLDIDETVDDKQASAAIKAIANVLSFQQQGSLPVQKDLYSENELKGETTDQLPNTGDNTYEEIQASDSDTSEQDLATQISSDTHLSAELVPTSDS
ncbi:hypothetical protein TanjilG_26894 [Lupinus angustifolius]|uniref:Nuclear/nucleolar GTPase 2 n=1 Tax=Lupinus angustifolius TaxID=3871 RepID=A0A4P1RJ25_LUPAN|nr:hypothetical protein TanjilG_26894 [Lupinus angustifolius]